MRGGKGVQFRQGVLPGFSGVIGDELSVPGPVDDAGEPVGTPRVTPTPESRKTGATASWITCPIWRLPNQLSELHAAPVVVSLARFPAVPSCA